MLLSHIEGGPVAFTVALATFVAGGIGAVIVGALAVYGGLKAITLLYTHKTVPLRIYFVGKKYKSQFNAHINEHSYIDNLIDDASNELLYIS